MWIHSRKYYNSKDSYAKIGAFLAVQFACMAKTPSDGDDVAFTPRSSRLEQQPSDKWSDIRFSRTMTQECSTRGPEAEVLLSAESSRF